MVQTPVAECAGSWRKDSAGALALASSRPSLEARARTCWNWPTLRPVSGLRHWAWQPGRARLIVLQGDKKFVDSIRGVNVMKGGSCCPERTKYS